MSKYFEIKDILFNNLCMGSPDMPDMKMIKKSAEEIDAIITTIRNAALEEAARVCEDDKIYLITSRLRERYYSAEIANIIQQKILALKQEVK